MQEKGHAKGTFDVKIRPVEDAALSADSFGRFAIEKQFHGDIEGTSKAAMITAATPVEGSAGYVALERVTGTIAGRKGSFTLQHLGMMGGGKFEITVRVLPDSGTDELKGLTGSMKIIIEGGKHFYEFEYSLNGAK